MDTYVIEYSARVSGDPDANIEVAGRLINSFARWSADTGLKLVAGYDRLDGTSGYLVVTGESTAAVLAALARFAPFAEFEIHPVLEFERSVPIVQSSLDWIRSVGF